MFSCIRTRWSNILINLFGVVSCLSLVLLLVISIPVFLFRVLVIYLAKWFRPDLGDILDGQGSLFSHDYFENTPPRSNIVVTEIFQGSLTYEEIKTQVVKNWINGRDPEGRLIFAKFQQYPVRWWGFTFWKNVGSRFSVDNHLIRLFDRDIPVTEDQMQKIVEKLLNTRHPKEDSPWDYYVVENYQYRNDSSSGPQVPHSALIFRIHHCLADGYSITRALTEGLGAPPLTSTILAEPRFPARSFTQQLQYIMYFPLKALSELSQAHSHNFRSGPWKIPDEKKHWHQIYVKVDPIPLQTIKDIKNHFGVSFTSVLLSAIAAAISKTGKGSEIKGNSNLESVQFLSTLPLPGRRQERNALANQSTGVIFELPVSFFIGSEDRLKTVNQILECTRHSVIPNLLRYYLVLGGCHLYPVNNLLLKNRMISMGLTNIPGVPESLELNGHRCVDVGFICGGNEGDAGMVIAVLSHGQRIRIEIAAEKGLLSRKQTKHFADFITEEIQHLFRLTQENIQ